MIKENEIYIFDRLLDLGAEYEDKVMALDDGQMFHYYENCLNRDVRIFYTGDNPDSIQSFCSFKKFWDICNELYKRNHQYTAKEFKEMANNYDLLYKLKTL